jgi:hypothetical protein
MYLSFNDPLPHSPFKMFWTVHYTVDLKNKFWLTVLGLSLEDPSFAAVDKQLNDSEWNIDA